MSDVLLSTFLLTRVKLEAVSAQTHILILRCNQERAAKCTATVSSSQITTNSLVSASCTTTLIGSKLNFC